VGTHERCGILTKVETQHLLLRRILNAAASLKDNRNKQMQDTRSIYNVPGSVLRLMVVTFERVM
jgi:hypothetical protein